MDFTYSVEQLALRNSVRRALADAYPDQAARTAATRSPRGWREDVWSALGELGVLDTTRGGPDEIGPVESGITAEEIGRVLAPEPFVDVAVLAARVLAEARETALLDAVSSGKHLAVLVQQRTMASTDETLTVRSDGGTWTVTGVSQPVRYGSEADSYLVASPAEGDTALVVVDANAAGVTYDAFSTHTGRSTASITFDEARCRPLGPAEDNTAHAVQKAVDAAIVAYCHEAIGAMETVLSLTTRYLKERHQFGRPLGSFQALKFRVADMHVALEQARSMTLWASMVLQDCAGDQARTQEAVAHAKVQVARASRLVGQSAVQLHGGIGLTSEHPIGHYHAHLVALSQLFGSEEHYLGLLMSSLSGHQHIDVLE